MAINRVITIPSQQTHIWEVSNRGELLGDLIMTRNIDLDSSRGKIRLAERIAILNDGLTDFTSWGSSHYPRAFIRTNADGTDRWWAAIAGREGAVSGSPLWNTSGSDPSSGWAQDVIVLPPTTAIDSMEIFLQASGADRLVVPDSSGDLNMLNSGNVITPLTVSAATNATPIAITTTASHGLFTGNKVTVASVGGNTAANGTWTITKTGATTFTLNTSVGNGNYTTGGTVATSAWKIAWWSGNLAQSVLTASYPMIVKKFDVNKVLLVCNSNLVHTIDSTLTVTSSRLVFPANYYINAVAATPDYAWFFLNNLGQGEALAIRWNGGTSTYDTPIKLYDRNVYAATILDGIPYCMNGKGQLLKYNGQSFQELDVLPVFYDNRRWTAGTTDNPTDGTPTVSNTLLNRNGMTVIDGKIHMFLRASLNSSEITTLENFGSGIWCYSPGIGFYCKYTVGQYRSTDLDWGAKTIASAGALVETDAQRGRFLLGGVVYQGGGSSFNPTADSILAYSKTSSTSSQRGQFITSQFHIPSLEGLYVHMAVVRSMWTNIAYSFERFANSTDRLIIKMRTNKDPLRTYQLISNITWTNTTTFTFASSGNSAFANAVVGNEIEFFVGAGAGATAHILSISLNAGTYTVILDEAIPNMAGSTYTQAYFNNWVKVSTVNVQTIQDSISALARNSSWIQFKGELRGTSTSPELKDLTAVYIPLAQ